MQTLRFDNRFVRELPADPHVGPQRRQVHGALYSWVDPTPVCAPRLLAHSPEVAALLGIDEAAVASPEFAQVFGGNALLEGMQPYAAAYGGHQFGNWAGQLGDGRAITLGETINAAGERWELQLKGAGPTPSTTGRMAGSTTSISTERPTPPMPGSAAIASASSRRSHIGISGSSPTRWCLPSTRSIRCKQGCSATRTRTLRRSATTSRPSSACASAWTTTSR